MKKAPAIWKVLITPPALPAKAGPISGSSTGRDMTSGTEVPQRKSGDYQDKHGERTERQDPGQV